MTACVASAVAPDALGAAVNSATAPKRPGGKTWSEVCEQVQKPDGSVRTSPPFKSWQDVNSPPRPRNGFSYHLGRLGQKGPSDRKSVGGSSLGGSSRGGSSKRSSSGRTSRSSTPAVAREGDISSRCSSGGWDTSTNSSVMSLQGDTPREESSTADANGVLKGLVMPDPTRPIALLAEEESSQCEDRAAEDEDMCTLADVPDGGSFSNTDSASEASGEVSIPHGADPTVQLGLKLTRDPYGRDAPRGCEAHSTWSPEPLAKYLKGVASQIDTNIQNHRLPTSEKLDNFVNRLVAHTHRQLRHAPKGVRHFMKEICTKRFHRFWNFVRNEKVRSTTPEELTSVLVCIVEALVSDVVVGPASDMPYIGMQWSEKKQFIQPKPWRLQQCTVDIGN